MGVRRLLTAVMLVLGLLPAAAVAQDGQRLRSPVLTIDSDRVFTDSAFGKRIAREFDERRAALVAEGAEIQARLTTEEKALTERRASMAPAAFRALADDFDARVQEIRKDQDAKARALGQSNETAQVEFLAAARPVLEGIMREAGAAVILDRRSVLLSADVIDVTNEAVRRINEAIGDGSQPEAPKE